MTARLLSYTVEKKKGAFSMEYVLITGGTSGIGYELAKIFARKQYGVLIVSGNSKKLENAKRNLERECNANILTFQQDLSQLGAAEKIYSKIKERNIHISLLINNAGVGTVGPIEEINLKQDESMLILNMINLTELCKLFVADMYDKKHGGILNVASTGAFQPGPYTSTYYASKVFVLSLSRAIRYEAKKKGVNVSVLCPGATKTEFFSRAGKGTPKGAMSPEEVAAIAYKGLMRNKEIIVPGSINKLLRFIPTKLKMIGIAKFQMTLKNNKDQRL